MYPHFNAACAYLLGAAQLDAAALALKRRCIDPALAAELERKPTYSMGPSSKFCVLLTLCQAHRPTESHSEAVHVIG